MTMAGNWAFQNAGLWQHGRRTSTARATAAAAQPMTYQITETTQLLLQRGDITRFEGDAIVNAGAGTLNLAACCSRLMGCCNFPTSRTAKLQTLAVQQTSACLAAAVWMVRSTARRALSCAKRAVRCRRWSLACAAPPARPA